MMPLYLGETQKTLYLGDVRKDVYLGDTAILVATAPPGRADGLMERTFQVTVTGVNYGNVLFYGAVGNHARSVTPVPVNLYIIGFNNADGRLVVESDLYNLTPGGIAGYRFPSDAQIKIKWGNLAEVTMERTSNTNYRTGTDVVPQADRAGYVGQTVAVNIATNVADIIAI